jgi:glycosyltransferase involved in cell wall biosynthesis
MVPVASRYPLLSVLIPIYNESATLEELYGRLTRVLTGIAADYEILFVDDGSYDESPAALHLLHKRDGHVKVVLLSRNFGHQAALSAAIAHASGEAVVCMDGDLQDPPEVIPSLVQSWRLGFEVVYAIRRGRKENILKRSAYRAFYAVLSRVADIPIPQDTGDFALLDRRVVDILKNLPERSRFLRGLRAWVGFRQKGIEYERASRFAGNPQYSLRKLLGLALDGIFSFSTVPLRLVSWLGVASSLIAMLCIGVVLYFRLFTERAIPGWASTVIPLLLLSGVQLLAIGVLGEYVVRIFIEVKKRPSYLVASRFGFDEKLPEAEEM